MADRSFEYKISFPAGDFSGATTGKAALDNINASADKVAASAAQAGVATDRFVDATGKLREANGRFVSTGQSVDEVKKKMSEAEQEADHFFDSLKAGINIDLGHRFVEGLAEIPAKFREIIEEGVRFNAQMETMQIGLAGAFRSSDPDRFGDFHAAEVAGTEALTAIQAKANELGLSIHSLSEGLSINMHGLAEGGVTDIKQQIDLIATLNQAAQAKGLDGARAGRDIVDLLQGRADRTLFGPELGIDDKDVKAAREAGKLYEFLTEKLSAYKEGGQAAANTFAAAEQRLTNETEQLYGAVSKPIFEALKDALNDINNQLKDGNTAEELRALGYDIAELAKDGATLLKWGIEVAPVLFRVAEGVGAVSLAIALLKLPGLIASLGQKSLAWLKNAEAIDTETAALVRNTGAAETNAAAKVTSGGARAASGAGGFLSTAGAGAAIGTGLVALEVGYALIKLIESTENSRIDKLHEESETDTAHVLSLQTQVDLADDAKKKDEARAAIKAQIARLDKEIAENETRNLGIIDQAQAEQDDGTLVKRETRRDLQHQLDTLEASAGKHLGDKENNTRGQKALDAYHDTDEYKLKQAELSGNQDDEDAYGFLAQVDKIKKELVEKQHLPDAPAPDGGKSIAQVEAEAQALANDLAKQRKGLNESLDRLESQTEKTKDAAGIKADLDVKNRDLAGALPGTNTADLSAVRGAIRDLPEGSQAEITQKEKLRDLLKEILALSKDYAAAKNSEDADARKVADAQKAHDDALASERLEVEILRARAAGNETLARQKERERDMQREITRLMQEHLTLEEATAVARDTINLKDDARDKKKDDAEARREEAARRREEREDRPSHRRGERETFVTEGYHDPNQDRNGGLHTGGLSTGNLGSSGTGTAAGALAGASTYVPSFPRSADGFGLATLRGNPLASVFAGDVLGPLFGAPSAGVGFGPAISALGPVGGASSAPGQPGPDSGHAGVTKAAEGTSQAARETTSATRELSRALSELFHTQTRELADQRHELEEVKKKIQLHTSQIEQARAW